MHYYTTHNINRRGQSERNELLAQVAKRAERAQLLVIIIEIIIILPLHHLPISACPCYTGTYWYITISIG